MRLLDEIRAAGYAGSYTQLKAFVRRVRPAPAAEPVIRFETAPGRHYGECCVMLRRRRFWPESPARDAVVRSMRRSEHPSRPSATIWWCLSSAKTLLMPRRNRWVPRRRQRLEPLLKIARFQLSINGRFWVSTEVTCQGGRAQRTGEQQDVINTGARD